MSIAVVLYDYIGQENDELSIKKYQELEIIQKNEDDWWLVRRGNDVGLIPSNYVYISQSPRDYNDNNSSSSSSSSKINGWVSPDIRNSNSSSKKSKSSPVSGMNQSDFLKLKQLREDAEKKIDALREAVISHESSKFDTNSNVTNIVGSPNKFHRPNNSKIIKSNMDVSLRHDDDHYHDEADRINEISNVMPSRDTSQIGSKKSLLTNPNMKQKIEQDNSSSSSSFPLLKNNKFHNTSNTKYDSITSIDKNTINDNRSKLPDLLTIAKKNDSSPAKKDGLLHHTPLKETVVIEGIRYPQCRSIVYGPSDVIENTSTINSSPPNERLSLKYVHGYDGDIMMHGGGIRGKNIMFVGTNRIIYPAAALVIIMDIDTNTQAYFSAHTENVTCVTCHPNRAICASGQMGKDGRICIWDQNTIIGGYREYNSALDMYIGEGVRGVCGLNFSGDGRYLVALGLDESHSMALFDWSLGTIVAIVKVGHIEVHQMGFNPFSYIPIDRIEEGKDLASPRGEQSQGCYTLVSCGGKQIKFWTFKRVLEQKDDGSPSNSTFRGRKLVTPQKRQKWFARYILEGNSATLPKAAAEMPDILCFVSVNDSYETRKSRVFTGTSNGSVYIWQQNDDNTSYQSWLPNGRLLTVVTDVHDSPVLDIDYAGNWSNDEYDSTGSKSYDGDKQWYERLISCGKDGIINIWRISRSTDTNALPFEHVSAVSLGNSDSSVGSPRSISWDMDGNTAIVGTTGNAILQLYGDGLIVSPVEEILSPRDMAPLISKKFILRSHSAKVRRVAAHTNEEVYATISLDKTIRLWHNSEQIAICRFVEKASCITFVPNSILLAVGNESGELFILESGALKRFCNDPDIINDSELTPNQWKIKFKRKVAARGGKIPRSVSSSVTSNQDDKKLIEKQFEVTELKYSPSGDILAIGCRDNLIHILSAQNNYKRIAICRGHSSYIKNIDFSSDGTILQSTDAVRELLYWQVSTGKIITNAHSVRNVKWQTWTCLYGWPVQGIFNGIHGVPQEGEINAVCRTNDSRLLVAGASNTVNGAIKLFNYPTLSSACPALYGGHTSPPVDIVFLVNDRKLISIGGNDTTIFEWELS